MGEYGGGEKKEGSENDGQKQWKNFSFLLFFPFQEIIKAKLSASPQDELAHCSSKCITKQF